MDEEQMERRQQSRGRLRGLGNVLYAALRFIAGHVHGFYTSILTFLSAGFILGVVMVLVFAWFSDTVMEGATRAFDVAVLRWVARYRTDGLDHIMIEITNMGNGAVLIVLVLVASVFLWLTHHRYSVYLLLIAAIGGHVLNNVLKEGFNRARPTVVEQITEVLSLSFPSGHAMTAMVTYGSIAYLVGRLEPTKLMRRVTWLIAGILILAIGASRIYLGVHYPTDVVGGFLAGIAWIGFVVAGIHALRFFAERKPEVEEKEKDLHAEEERTAGLRA